MNDLATELAGQDLLADLGPSLLQELASGARELHLAADQHLFRTGGPADRLYLVRTGRLALDMVGGGRPMTVDTYGSGSMVGMSWLVPPYTWYLDARATEPSDVVELDATLLRQRCDADPRLGYLLLQKIAHEMYQRMQSARVRLLDVYGARGAG